MTVGHVSNVPGTMESCPTYYSRQETDHSPTRTRLLFLAPSFRLLRSSCRLILQDDGSGWLERIDFREMKLFRNLDELPDRFRRGALSIGNFDGVHRGHARILERLAAMARRVGGPALVFTFDPHPAQILRPDRAPSPLTWTERNAELLLRAGADAVIAHPADLDFLQRDARQFFAEVVRGRLDAQAMVEGANFLFGRNRSGDIGLLQQFCDEAGILLDVVQPLEIDGAIVSSSRLRALIAAGDIDGAGRLLTQPYRIRGRVIRGAGRGRTLGYPTANLGQVDTLVPGEGIYAGRAWVGETPFAAAVSIGPNPTFEEGPRKIEIYLIGYEGSLYDQVLEVEFLARLRDVRRFESAEALIAQMNRDVALTGEIVARYEAGPAVYNP